MLTKYLSNHSDLRIRRTVKGVIALIIIIVFCVRLYQSQIIARVTEGQWSTPFQTFVFISGNKDEQNTVVLYDEEVVLSESLVEGRKGLFRVFGSIEFSSANSHFIEKRLIVSRVEPYSKENFSLLYINHCCSSFITKMQKRIKYEYFDFLSKIFSLNFASLMTTMCLGSAEAPKNPELKDMLRLSGFSHVIAVSGMHVNFVFYGIFGLSSVALEATKKITKTLVKFICTIFGFELKIGPKECLGVFLTPLKLRVVFCMLILLLFVIFVGTSASSLRAFLQIIIISINRYFLHIKQSKFLVLSLVFIVLVIYNPHFLFEVGFLLSFSIAFGFSFFSLLKKRLLAKYLNLNRNLIEVLTNFVPFIFSGLITLIFFNELNLAGLLSNYLLLWAIPFILVLSYLFLFFFLFLDFLKGGWFFLVEPLLKLLSFLADSYLSMVDLMGSFSWSVIYAQNRFGLCWPLLFYLLIAYFFYIFILKRQFFFLRKNMVWKWRVLCC